MKSADGGGRSRPPIPERKPPVPERRPPIPAHKPPAPPRPSAAPASSATGDYSPPPRAERDGISPTTAAVLTALAMSAAQPDYGQRRVSVGDIIHGVPGLRIFLRLLAWLVIITYLFVVIVNLIRWDIGGEFYVAPFALLLGWIFIANTQKRPKPTPTDPMPSVTPVAETAMSGDPRPAPNATDWQSL